MPRPDKAPEECPHCGAVLFRCVKCAKPISNLWRVKEPLCSECSRIWDRPTIIRAIQTWAATHGGMPPVLRDTHGTPKLPSKRALQRNFPNWADAVEAAGFPRPLPGVHQRSAQRSQQRAIIRTRQMVTGGLGVAGRAPHDRAIHGTQKLSDGSPPKR